MFSTTCLWTNYMERLTVALEPLIYDEKTGLPTLPEGYAWKVDENEYSHYEENPEEKALVVRIAKLMTREHTWWDRLIGREAETFWTTYDHEFSDSYEKCANDTKDLKAAASTAYNTIRNEQLRSEKLQTLVGLYPPKSIL